jgi:hypothetical protein
VSVPNREVRRAPSCRRNQSCLLLVVASSGRAGSFVGSRRGVPWPHWGKSLWARIGCRWCRCWGSSSVQALGSRQSPGCFTIPWGGYPWSPLAKSVGEGKGISCRHATVAAVPPYRVDSLFLVTTDGENASV